VPVIAAIAFEELADFATSFADEHDHVDFGLAGSRDLSQQRAFADTAARENAQSLTASAGQERVDRPHAGAKAFADRRAIESRHRRHIR
jgi:hypothetical protein